MTSITKLSATFLARMLSLKIATLALIWLSLAFFYSCDSDDINEPAAVKYLPVKITSTVYENDGSVFAVNTTDYRYSNYNITGISYQSTRYDSHSYTLSYDSRGRIEQFNYSPTQRQTIHYNGQVVSRIVLVNGNQNTTQNVLKTNDSYRTAEEETINRFDNQNRILSTNENAGTSYYVYHTNSKSAFHDLPYQESFLLTPFSDDHYYQYGANSLATRTFSWMNRVYTYEYDYNENGYPIKIREYWDGVLYKMEEVDYQAF